MYELIDNSLVAQFELIKSLCDDGKLTAEEINDLHDRLNDMMHDLSILANMV